MACKLFSGSPEEIQGCFSDGLSYVSDNLLSIVRWDFRSAVRLLDFGKNLLKHNVKVVFASDYVGVFADAERARRYEIWWRTQAFGSNFEVLKQMTSTAGELLTLSGPRNPYLASGKIGVIEVGAAGDILLVDGNPLEDISVLGANEQWFDADPEYKEIDTLKVIMKDGVIYKNSL